MKKLLIVVMIMILTVSFAFAQEELDTKKMDAGLRGGVRYGATARYFLSESNAAELLFTMRGSGIIVTGMYQWHKPLSIGEVEGLTWYFGGGKSRTMPSNPSIRFFKSSFSDSLISG